MTTVIVDPTGTDDHLVIAAAIAASSAGDTVQLSTGTFACAASLALAAGVDLVGSAGTVLAYAGTVARRLALLGDNTLSTLSITGPLTVDVQASDCTVSDVYSTQSQATWNAPELLYGRAAFRVTSRTVVDGALAPVERVTFERCTAHETYGTGFYLDGDPEGIDPVDIPSRYSDITFRDCLAEGCGTGASRHNNYVVGFNLGESSYPTMRLSNVQVVDCIATGNWESGYHAEFAPSYAGCTITGCTATGNGVNPTPSYAAGFLVAPGWAVTDCTADGNALVGFRVGTHPNNGHVGDPVSLTRCTAIGPASPANYYGFLLHGATVGLELGGVLLDTCTCQDNGPLATAHLRDVRDVCIRDFAEINCPASVLAYANCTYYLAPFSTTPAAPVTGEAVAFADLSDNDGLTAWSWDFGDGNGSAAQHPTHVYPSAGVYPVTLAAGGNVVAQTITVVPGVSYGGARLSEADIAPLDHDPTCNATDLLNGRVGLQGSPVSRRTWTINALADDHAEIDALDALMGQRLTLNINGTEYPGTMIRPPFIETQLTPSAWAYQVGFVQETRR